MSYLPSIPFANATGEADAYTVSTGVDLAEIAEGLALFLRIPFGKTNTGAPCTLNVDGLGAKEVLNQERHYPAPGALAGGSIHLLIFDGLSFQVVA